MSYSTGLAAHQQRQRSPVHLWLKRDPLLGLSSASAAAAQPLSAALSCQQLLLGCCPLLPQLRRQLLRPPLDLQLQLRALGLQGGRRMCRKIFEPGGAYGPVKPVTSNFREFAARAREIEEGCTHRHVTLLSFLPHHRWALLGTDLQILLHCEAVVQLQLHLQQGEYPTDSPKLEHWTKGGELLTAGQQDSA